jgi:hypothetical protein
MVSSNNIKQDWKNISREQETLQEWDRIVPGVLVKIGPP